MKATTRQHGAGPEVMENSIFEGSFGIGTLRDRAYTLTKADMAGRKLYAVGDIHGRLDCLQDILSSISKDAVTLNVQPLVVTLGDYGDRGPHTAQVIELLSGSLMKNMEIISLAGNHDEWLRLTLAGDAAAASFMFGYYGFWATLRSYGMNVPVTWRDGLTAPEYRQRLAELVNELRGKIPPHHQAWLNRLGLRVETPGAHLVHAGFYPGVDIIDQDPVDLTEIREDFLDSGHDFGKPVYHGHTIFGAPEDHGFRISLDTGGFGTGIVTAARIGDDGRPERYLAGVGRMRARPVFAAFRSETHNSVAEQGRVADIGAREQGPRLDRSRKLWADWAAQIAAKVPDNRIEFSGECSDDLVALSRALGGAGPRYTISVTPPGRLVAEIAVNRLARADCELNPCEHTGQARDLLCVRTSSQMGLAVQVEELVAQLKRERAGPVMQPC